jgi:hypothetical protein
MASSRSAAPSMQKCLQIGLSRRLDRTLAFQELCADTGDLDNERTMSDADGGRSSGRPFGPRGAPPVSSVSVGLPGRSRYDGRSPSRFPTHIDGGRFAPLVHRSGSDACAKYALTDAWDSSAAGADGRTRADTESHEGTRFVPTSFPPRSHRYSHPRPNRHHASAYADAWGARPKHSWPRESSGRVFRAARIKAGTAASRAGPSSSATR